MRLSRVNPFFPRLFLLACFALLAVASRAGEPPAPPADTTTLDTVLVTGEQPGLGLWKVSKGDHVLWLLGAQYPLPRDMTWRAGDVEQTIAQSQEVIADATPKLELSFFHKLTLMPAVYGARKNEDGATLKDVLPADVYAHWLALKAKYIGNDRGVERLRPMVAANELYEKALKKSGLARNGLVWEVVRAAARKHDVRIVEPTASIPMDDAKQTIRDFKTTTGDLDVECLQATMRRLDNDLEATRQRANAWAIGDIDALRRLAPTSNPQEACIAAVGANPRLHAQLEAARVDMDHAWLAAAEQALRDNASSFAVLPMDELLRPDRRLAMLAARGYTVEAPE
jgi:uncharacterized protein YbaP (TraB family)